MNSRISVERLGFRNFWLWGIKAFGRALEFLGFYALTFYGSAFGRSGSGLVCAHVLFHVIND